MTAGVAEATWRLASVVHGPPNNSMQLTALRAAADAERSAGDATVVVSQRLIRRRLILAQGVLPDMEPTVISHVRLRDIEQDDLPRLYEFNLDPDANCLAATIPRSADAFDAHWENALSDPNVVAKAISVGDVLAGCVSCFKHDGLDHVGYWVAKEFWGTGIASRAYVFCRWLWVTR